MATIDKITIDIVQETLHDQIKKLAETFYKQSGVRLESVDISWSYSFGTPPEPYSISIKTSKR